MATTPVATSALATIDLNAYSYDNICRMFECKQEPVGEANVALDMGQGLGDDVLAAPGAGKYLYIWAGCAMPGSVGSPASQIVLVEGTALTGAFITLPTPSSGGSNVTAPLWPIRHKCAANTKVQAFNFGTSMAAANGRVRLLFCVLSV